jgi:gliding motility-associated-like protein
MKINVLLLFLLLTFAFDGFSQIDTEFWFAAPELSSGHGDAPIYLRINAFDKDATITIDQPANSAFAVITRKVNANQSISIDLTLLKEILENKPANQVLYYGLHIVASEKVAAYYEIANSNNSDIFALKGRNGLGTNFYVPAQTDFENVISLVPTPYNSFDIVATEDNTSITITPKNNAEGHNSGIPFTIKLNKGQTYSVKAASHLGSQHLAGSKVQSNRPIAITIKDDSVTPGGCYDLNGDQIVPVEVVGKEYVVVKGFLNASVADRVYVLATQNNTRVFIDGSTGSSATLNAGSQYSFKLTSPSTYIKATAPVYVYHITGFGCEVGGALLPPIICTGSNDISFVRSSNEYFGIVLLTMKGHEGSFSLNGSSSAISTSNFQEVPGTNGKWVAASIDLQSNVSNGTANRLTNSSGVFNLGIINGGVATTCRYGFFSDFSSLYIGEDRIICQGDSIKLDARQKCEKYLWNTGDTVSAIYIEKQGQYWLKVKRDECELADTMNLNVKFAPKIELGADTNLCLGQRIILNPGNGFFKYQWQNKSSSPILGTDTSGFYKVKVTDSNNCSSSDSVRVSVHPYPVVQLNKDTVFCGSLSAFVNLGADSCSVKWTGLNTELSFKESNQNPASVTASKWGTYFVKAEATSQWGCTVTDTMKVGFYPKPTSAFSVDSSKCWGFNIDVKYTGNASINADYLWDFDKCVVLSGEKQGPFNVAIGSTPEDKNLKLVVLEDGCFSDTTFKIIKVTPNFVLKSDTNAGCEPLNINFSALSSNKTLKYHWDFGDGKASDAQNVGHLYEKSGLYDIKLTVTATNGCQNSQLNEKMIAVYQIPTSKFSADSLICYPDTLSLKYLGNATPLANYHWNFSDLQVEGGQGQGPFLLNQNSAKQRWLSLWVEENNCFSSESKIRLKRIPHLNPQISPAIGCQPLSVKFTEPEHEAFIVYDWYLGITGDKIISARPDTAVVYTQEGKYSVSLKVKSTETACENFILFEDTVVVFPKPNAQFEASPKVVLIDNPLIRFVEHSSGASTYNWNFGDSTKSTEQSPVHVYSLTGTYNVQLIAISEKECMDTAYLKVAVGSFFAPDAFCPSSDIEKNRVFMPVAQGMELAEFQLKIYNRWGNLVFTSTSPSDAWDGTIDGREGESGAYVWTVSYKDIKGKINKHWGTVSLIR